MDKKKRAFSDNNLFQELQGKIIIHDSLDSDVSFANVIDDSVNSQQYDASNRHHMELL